jgi:hypothetical protein
MKRWRYRILFGVLVVWAVFVVAVTLYTLWIGVKL